MAMAVDPAFERAFTVSADHRLVRVDLAAVSYGCLAHSNSQILAGTAGDGTVSEYSTKQVGNGAVAISADGRVVAVGGWDGR
jgi:hypothetical protein